MVCPNCQSSDIIEVQGEHFCLSCGKITESIKTSPASKKAKPAGEPASTTSDSKRDALPEGVEIIPLDGVEPPATIVGGVSQLLADPPPVVAAPPRKRGGGAKAPAAQTADTSVAKQRADTKTAKSRAAVVTKTAAENPAASKPATTTKPAPTPKNNQPMLGYVGGGVNVWLNLAVLATVATGGVLALVVAGANIVSLPTRLTGDWNIASAAITVAVLFYFVRCAAATAIAYGVARQEDHRPVPRKHWYNVAVNNIGTEQVLSYTGLTLQLAPVVAAAALWAVLPPLTHGLNQWLSFGLLATVYATLVYLTFSLTVAWRLAEAALVLGRINPFKALWLGLCFAFRHFSLLVTGFWSLLVEFLSLLAPVTLATAVLSFAASSQLWLLMVAVVPLTIVTAVLDGAFNGAWWQHVYRRLIRHERLYQALDLLAARPAEKPRASAAIIFWILLTMIVVIIGAWPWLP